MTANATFFSHPLYESRMFGGGGMNPRKMQKMMEQMGIDLEELDAEAVVITLESGEDLVFEDPDVTRMDARGQQTYQIVGEPVTQDQPEPASTDDSGASESDGIPADDVELVMQRAGVDEETARDALEEADGDLASAISQLE